MKESAGIMGGASIALKFGSLIAGAGIFLVLFKKVKALKTYGLPGLLYVIVSSLLLSLSTLTRALSRASYDTLMQSGA